MMSLKFGPVFIAQTQLESHKSERSHYGLLDQPESGGAAGHEGGGSWPAGTHHEMAADPFSPSGHVGMAKSYTKNRSSRFQPAE